MEPDVEPPAPDPALKESHRSPPDVVPPEPAAGAGAEAVPDEPGAGLEQVRMTPLDKSTPVPRGAGASPGALHDSGTTPASIARGSRGSITAHSVEVRGGRFVVFRRLTGLLLRRPLRRGPIPPLGIQPRKSFISVKESVRGGFNWATEGNPIRAAATGKASSRGMRARRRGLSRLQATKIADQSLGQFPIARRPTRRYPPDARRPSTMARMRRRSSSGSECQFSTTCLRSAGSAPDFAPPESEIVVLPGNLRAGSIPASATVPSPPSRV